MRLRYYEFVSLLCVPLLLVAIIFGFGQTTIDSVSIPNVKAASITTQKTTGNPVVDSVNAIRIKNNIPPLQISKDASDVAKIRAQDMVERSYYAHVDPDGEDFSKFIEDDTYACENLYLGETNKFSPVESWIASIEHYECLINPRVSTIGYYTADYNIPNSRVAVLILSE